MQEVGQGLKLDIKIQVPYKLQRFLNNPTPEIRSILRDADWKALVFLRSEIRDAAPKGKTGDLADSIEYDLDKRMLFSNLIYSRAIELGHYASPKNTPKKMFLHFTDAGKEVFLRFVRTKKQPFFFKTLDRNRVKVIDIYEKAFAKMLEKL